MQLRDHPLMSYRGVKNWPPTWAKQPRGESITGEVGILTFVYDNPAFPHRGYLVIDHHGETYVGTLLFDDRAFCHRVSELLRLHLKRPIAEIGGLDI